MSHGHVLRSVLSILFVASSASAASTTPNGRPALGINLAWNDDYSPEIHFVDVMRQSRQWNDSTWNTASIPSDANGYPLQIPSGSVTSVQTAIFDAINGHYPGGTYTLILTGSGQVTLNWDASGTYTAPGTYSVNVTPSNNGINLQITSSTLGNPINGIHLIMPSYASTYQTQPINPAFSQPIQGMSVLRFMDTMRTNSSPVTDVSQIVPPTYYTQGGPNGMAPELIAAICNTVNADCWVNIPAMADDAWVTAFAQKLYQNLNPNLMVYVEYSNEIWNSAFPQGSWMATQGKLCSDANWGSDRRGYQIYRSAQIWQIFQQQFGGLSRLVRVAGGFMASSSYTQNILACFSNASLNPLGQKPDAVAMGAYFATSVADSIASSAGSTSIAQVEALSLASIKGEFTNWMLGTSQYDPGQKAVALQYGVRLVAYEGGSSLVGTGNNVNIQALTDLLAATNRDPGMIGLYQQMFNVWYNNGGELFLHYDYVGPYNKWGSWGALEWQSEPASQAPKWQALQTELTSLGGSASPPPPSLSICDVNQDGSTTATDVQLEVNQALKIAPCTVDINVDGGCDILDVQRVANAALGGPCVSP